MSRSASWTEAGSTPAPASAPTSTAPTPPLPPQDGPIRAYAKLEFPGFSYYIQTLPVTIGRRPQGPPPSPVGTSWSVPRDVDVDLGPLKSISRMHARIFYSAQVLRGSVAPPPADAPKLEGQFMLEVLGRNGAFVDDVWVGMNGVVPLGPRIKIQIAERVFYFVLPPPPSSMDEEEEEDEEGVEDEEEGAPLSSDLSDASPPAKPPKLVLKPRAQLPKRPHESEDDDVSKRIKEEAPDTPLPFQKPDLSNVQLITNALSSESCAKKGHKLTLQEVYEWLQNTYPWFSQNGRKTGRDWQSSIRHTIGTSREFCKVPRRSDEPGKGIFYTLATSDLAKAQQIGRAHV